MTNQVRVSAYVLIVDGDKMLMCRLSEASDDPGRWTLPGGGLEFGEHPEAAAKRELAEETGFVIEIESVASIDSVSLPEVHGVRIIYWGRIVCGELRHEVKGSTDLAAWIPLQEIGTVPLVNLAEIGVRIVLKQHAMG